MAGLAARKPFLMLERDRFTGGGLREVRRFARRHREARLLQRTGKSPCAGKRIRERACISSTRRRRTPGKRGAHAPVSRNRGTRPGVPAREPRGREASSSARSTPAMSSPSTSRPHSCGLWPLVSAASASARNSLLPSPAIHPWANPAWTGDEAGMDEMGAFAGGKTGTGLNGIGMAAASSWPGLAEFENYVGHVGIRCYPWHRRAVPIQR